MSMSSGRTVRTYGRRPAASASSPPPGMVYAPSSSGTLLFTPPSSPSSSKGKGRTRVTPLALGDSTDAEDDAGSSHPPSSPTQCRKRRRRDASPPLLIPLHTRDSNRNAPEPTPTGTAPKQGSLKSFFAPAKRVRVGNDAAAAASTASAIVSRVLSSAQKTKPKRESTPTPQRAPPPRMHQLQFMTNAVQTCPECAMSYMRGTDDTVHKRHHTRVTRGIPWTGRKEAKTVKDRIPLSFSVKVERDASRTPSPDGEPEPTPAQQPSSTLLLNSAPSRSAPSSQYRIVSIDANTSGRLIADILSTVDTVLAAPALPPPILARCKLFLAITSCEPPLVPGAKRRPGPRPKDGGTERVVGVVLSQPIKWAMRVLREGEDSKHSVDSGDGVICDPTHLPTPLGIHRLFTVPAYRGCGLAAALLDASAAHTVYGCRFHPSKGQVAFSQPTESGKRVMERWGRGGIRVFVDDESQL